MSSAISAVLLVSGLMLGLIVGVGGVYMGLIPNPEAQVLEFRLAEGVEEISDLEIDIEQIEATLEAERQAAQNDIIVLESSIESLQNEVASKNIMITNLEMERESIQLEIDSLLTQLSQKEGLEEEIAGLQDQGERLSVQIFLLSNER